MEAMTKFVSGIDEFTISTEILATLGLVIVVVATILVIKVVKK